MSSSQAIRAGAAFVEVFMKDESVKRSMADLKMKWQAFGATVNAVGTESFSGMNAGASTALAATAVSAGTATAGMALVGSAVYATANAFRVLFSTITMGVTKAAFSLRGIGYIVRDIFPKGGMVQGAFDKFLNASGTMEKAGRWGRLVGAVTGNSFIRGLGVQVERMGMGAAIERGFRDGGFAGYLKAYIGAGFRSIPSMLTGLVASTVTAPFRAGMAVVTGGAARTAVAITTVATATNSATAAMARATIATRSLAGAMASVAGLVPGIAAFAFKVAAVAGVIATAGMAAARGFASSSSEIVAKAKETGKSIQALIQEKYGKFSFITPADIRAGDALSQSMKELKQQTAAAFAQLGIAAMPALKKTVEFMTNVTAAITRFVAENRELIGSIIGIAGKVAKVAGAVVLLPTALSAIGVVVAAAMNPVVLITAAIAAAVAMFPQLRQAAMDAFSALASAFQQVKQSAIDFFNYLFPNFAEVNTVISDAINGILTALQAGSWQAAGEVAMAGLRLAWLAGSERLREIYRSVMMDVQIATEEAMTQVQSAWAITATYAADIWQAMVAIFNAAMEPVYEAIDSLAQAWGYVSEAAVSAWTYISDAATSAMNQIYEAVEQLRSVWEGVANYVSGVWDAVVEKMTGVFSAFFGTVSTQLQELAKSQAGQALGKALPGGAALSALSKAQESLSAETATKEREDRHKALQDRLAAIKEESAARKKAIVEGKVESDSSAKSELEAARERFRKSIETTDQMKRKQGLAASIAETKKASSDLTSGFGSFSAATAGLQGVSGLGKLEESSQKTAENTTKMAEHLAKGSGSPRFA